MTISPEQVANGSISLDWVDLDREGNLFFVEGRPQEKGRSTLLKLKQDSSLEEMTPAPFNVRSKVHEYGGKAYCLGEQEPFFINFADQILYQENHPLTDGDVRLADMISVEGGLIGVAEEGEENYLVFFNAATKELKPLFKGHDFVAAPILSPDGKKLAWISWNHPLMPWQGSTLWTARWENHTLIDPQPRYGSSTESIFQPGWSPSGELIYVSDRSGFWNLYQEETSLFPMQKECGRPLWVLGMRTWDIDEQDLVLAFQNEGSWQLAHRKNEVWRVLPFEAADISSLRVRKGVAYFAASFNNERRKIVSYDLLKDQVKFLYGESLDLTEFSLPEAIKFPSNGREIPAFFYPTKTSKPPLLIKVHGGPTAQSTPAFNWTFAYWNSLGFAVLDVNYTGSTGYGRAFREALNGHWGIYDWQDCEAGARYLIEKGLVDPKAIFITGGSSGGFTVLSALAYSPLFTGGSSYYGVSDLKLLDEETHKFESHYLDSLVGPTFPPSPSEYIQKPLLLFQGLDDKVVPPNQSEKVFEVLRKKGVPTELVLYEGEGHGFKKKETIIDTLKREAEFYKSLIFGVR